jgi:hypothetical protein
VIQQSIERGAAYLLAAQNPDGSWGLTKSEHAVGYTALVAYALLESGLGLNHPKIKLAMEYLSSHESQMTYDLAVRCNVWLIANRRSGGQYREALQKDASLLLSSVRSGAYSYYCGTRASASGDHSNSQYAVLGVWAAARYGIEIPQAYWQEVLKHWTLTQNSDGGWSYSFSASGQKATSDSTATMTAAGRATILVCADHIQSEQVLGYGEASYITAMQRGMAWLENHFDKAFTHVPTRGLGDIYYYFYGLERVGLANGCKYIGAIDWYRVGLDKILGTQQKDGGWPAGQPAPSTRLTTTAFAILFLCRGRAPILFNKLEYNGDWNSRPRDLSHLCAYLSDTYEKTLGWQSINFRVPVAEWHDAPVLYLSGTGKPTFSPEEIEKLRQYVYQGGTIFSCT